jgi:hypothetical protein
MRLWKRRTTFRPNLSFPSERFKFIAAGAEEAV